MMTSVTTSQKAILGGLGGLLISEGIVNEKYMSRFNTETNKPIVMFERIFLR